MTKEQCKLETEAHINMVRLYLDKFSSALEKRGKIHDQSKLESPEIEIFAEYTPKLKNTTYGSDEYKQYLKEMQVALDHHYKNNSHHPEYYNDGVNGMNLLDIIEMFCDWKAATLRHADGDMNKSIEYNKIRFKISEQLIKIFQNTVEFINE